jgi:hypothetical protein
MDPFLETSGVQLGSIAEKLEQAALLCEDHLLRILALLARRFSVLLPSVVGADWGRNYSCGERRRAAHLSRSSIGLD